MKVLKFGGTSVGSPERFEKLWPIIQSQKSDCHFVVLSAVAGTTNALVAIATQYTKGEIALARQLVQELQQAYQVFVDDLFVTTEGKEKGKNWITRHFTLLDELGNDLFTPAEERLVLAQGELLSTGIFHLYLAEKGIDSVLLPALEFMRINADQEPDMPYIQRQLQAMIDQFPTTTLFITQGYICRNSYGQIDNLRRGGSDYTASLLGAALAVEEIQIWTDIDGFHNNDPRYVSNTKPIAQLSFNEAAELAYFGAKIMHPQSVFPAQKANIPVRLLDTLDMDAAGTLISSAFDHTDEIVAVAAKDNITAIRIQSSRMLLAYGFLRRVFEVFERYKTPIDMITTSEVAVSLTLDDCTYLSEIIAELNHFGEVEVDDQQSIICIVGDFKRNKNGYATLVSEAVKHMPIRMISYGGSEHNISLLLPSKYKIEALRALHHRLF
ncbi:aspartate kinase [Myroides fluvii]|uniref:aspartate kinase n=1 Tax=Myroides fluvii TaxID=2572594 RepID=UPI00131EC173|nr:aspartate kinase [Myroides fluvii]